ncbi:MAG TPA: anti-sigma factor [Candidatus Binatia bacterium]|nr:anti-sigma factor [Candidatus Binatia bacterium]
MKCKNVRARLSAFQDGELAPPQLLEVARHLEECAACRGETEALNRLLAGLGRWRAPEADFAFAARVMAALRAQPEKKFRLLPSLAYTVAALAVFISGFLLEMSANGRPAAAPQTASTFSSVLLESRQLGLLAVQESTLDLFGGDFHEE